MPQQPTQLDADLDRWDVDRWIDANRPRPGVPLFWIVAVGGAIVLLGVQMLGGVGASPTVVSLVNLGAFVAVMVALGATLGRSVRRMRREQDALQEVEDLVRLRRWPDALGQLRDLFATPARTLGHHLRGLLCLASVLMRYERFDKAIDVQTYLLGFPDLAADARHGVKVALAMSLLHEDRLLDADTAISELRRSVDDPDRSAGFGLVQMYRDVVTNHPDEALSLFEKYFAVFREQLGHRLGDAYVMSAWAHDRLGDATRAATDYHRATLLSPASELHRRFPETSDLADRYAPAAAPPGMS